MSGGGQIAGDHLKRGFDCFTAAFGLVLLAPFLVVAAIAVRLGSPGPILHRGLRVGRGGRLFRILKLRTMYVGADSGPPITFGDDPRVTPIGRVLRRSKLDELPQLINVLRGEMSLVGPRPEHPQFVALYTTDQRRVLALRPGITGASAVAFRDEERMLIGPDAERHYREVVMPAKLALELDYLERRSLLVDLRLLALTLIRVLMPSLSGGQPRGRPSPPR